MQIPVARSQAEEAPGGDAHNGLGLLVAGIKGVVPDVPPGGEPAQGVGGNAQCQHSRKAQGRAGQGDGAHAAGTQIGDDEKGAEEDQRRAEVVHQRQQAADDHGIGNEEDQIPLVHDPVHGGSTGVHKADLAELRGLQGQIADDQPVLRAVVFLAEEQRHHQKAHTGQHRQIAEALGPLQVPEGPADEQKHQNAQNHGSTLLAQLPGLHRGNGRRAQGAQEEGQSLYFKGAAANGQIEKEQPPLAHRHGAEAQKIGSKFLLRPVQQEAREHHRLQKRQYQQA